MVDITYRCTGCFAEETVQDVRPLQDAEHGVRFGMVRYAVPTIELAAPKGWVAWDPYTLCTYCPACWATIEGAAVSSSDEAAE
jgi:hypothetical protein